MRRNARRRRLALAFGSCSLSSAQHCRDESWPVRSDGAGWVSLAIPRHCCDDWSHVCCRGWAGLGWDGGCCDDACWRWAGLV
ncbi:hypothetical protein IWX90DRAFT_424567 [Phyllosticta citrichinensis]|uniref:Secreted protein n=1 Tax=Phyllosticta citrichinensis TaxID=1130410 RepID=A0ABR1Y3M5_9PEZI